MMRFVDLMWDLWWLVQYLLLSVTDPGARFKPVGVSDVRDPSDLAGFDDWI